MSLWRWILAAGVLAARVLAAAWLWTSPITEVRASEVRANDDAGWIRFEDVTEAAGVDFRGPASPKKEYILESVSGGVALFDADGDGWVDIYLVDSLTVATSTKRELSRSALYRNRGDGTFEDVAERAGVADVGWGVGVCSGDVDGNGLPDLYVTGVGGNHLFLNRSLERGEVAFEDATDAAGVRGGGWSTGCTFGDVDLDGDLDLFVARYQDLDPYDPESALPTFGEGKLCEYRGVKVQCGPRGLPGKGDLFFVNDGTGRFAEAPADVGLSDPGELFGLGAVFFDANDDGRPDLYVANDTVPNFLFINQLDRQGRTVFVNEAFLVGVAVSQDGDPQGSMGVAVGDVGNEGLFDLFVTNFCEEYNTFYDNQDGGGFFADVSFRSAVAASSLAYVGWGTAFVDFDHDRWLDLVLVNGHVYPQIDQIEIEASAPYRQRDMLFRNRGDGTFADQSRPEAADNPLAREAVSRGLAVGDLDGDGRMDLVITDLDEEARVLRNVTDAGHWLNVRLVGRPPNTSALGARVTVRAGADTMSQQTMSRQVMSGGSYLSQHDLRQHFGLGDGIRADFVQVRWPDGRVTRHGPLDADQFVVLRPPPATPSLSPQESR